MSYIKPPSNTALQPICSAALRKRLNATVIAPNEGGTSYTTGQTEKTTKLA